MPSHLAGREPDMDQSVPALIIKVGSYPWHHGGVGAIRSLGRLGVPVYAVVEDRRTPAAVSRYLQDRFVWPTTGLEDPGWLVQGLLDIGRRIGRPAVLIACDDEAAVLVAEHAPELSETFLFPDVKPSLPRLLADKGGLYRACLEHGVPTPWAATPSTIEELDELAATVDFPVVVKNLEAFQRLRTKAVVTTTGFDDFEHLRSAAETWGEQFSVLVQQYVPIRDAEDWIVHAYCDEFSNCLVQFSGVKIRSYPPHAGATTSAYSVGNSVLTEITARFVKDIGFRGVLDLDWRYDRRDGQYKLLDFNPRVGAQFRLFENEAGVDVVRALHMDMTGREVPAARQVDGRHYVVESLDPISLLAPDCGYTTPSAPARATATELAWFAWDDILPALVMFANIPLRALRRLQRGRLQRMWRSRRAELGPASS